MSRLLGKKARRDKIYQDHGPEAEGRIAQGSNIPITANPYGYAATNDKGKAHAWSRGWQRAAASKRKG